MMTSLTKILALKVEWTADQVRGDSFSFQRDSTLSDVIPDLIRDPY
jgi:hypothetical protein